MSTYKQCGLWQVTQSLCLSSLICKMPLTTQSIENSGDNHYDTDTVQPEWIEMDIGYKNL